MRVKLISLILFVCIYTMNVSVAFAADDSYYTAASVKDVENIIYNVIDNRISTIFRIKYTGNTDSIMSDIRAARDAAVKRDAYEEGCISLISGFKVSKFSDHADITFDGFTYYTDPEKEKYVDSEVKRITSEIITPNMTDSQKEKAIHDYILSHMEYDYSLNGYTAYSALHDGKTVCNGYVQTAYRLFMEAGMNSIIVKGTYTVGGKSEDHEWNLVKIDGKWYHLDITLDDSSSAVSSSPYKYYNLSDAQIKESHSFDAAAYPAATSQFPSDTIVPTEPSTPASSSSSGSGSFPAGIPNTVVVDTYLNALQPANKTWILKFNKYIGDNADTGLISVYDSSNNKVPGIKVQSNLRGNEIIITAPENGYKSGESYYILVSENFKPTVGSSLKTDIKIPFKIK